MKVFTEAEASKDLSKLLALAAEEEVMIRRRDGTLFALRVQKVWAKRSPFDIPGVKTRVNTEDILQAIREIRGRDFDQDSG
ncbi:antitoxin Phd [Methylomarinovum tepidoasis]|uniref:Antitoxin Phd n=1 Tax=Methylomarinovum tepidoasis TaxID=2840183 RepID=A0AAU9C1I2_9GAMM|nr:prevent-host-death protein [Methylomarinovum sp. IN45]BCX89960.1 antitoxin Phd [Methylomarinovum sp. IN45]